MTEQRSLDELYPQATGTNRTIALAELSDTGPTLNPSAALRQSMATAGQLVPVIVTRAAETYRILDGRRRVAAARALGWETIQATVYHGTDALQERTVAAAANAVRSANPLTDLAAILALSEAGYTEREIARATGLSVGTIRKRRKLNQLPTVLLGGVLEGRVAVGTAERAASLPAHQREALGETYAETGRLTGDDVTAATRASQAQAAAALPAELFAPVPAQPAPERFAAALRELIARFEREIDRGHLTRNDVREALEEQLTV